MAQSDSESEGPARISKLAGRQLLKWAQGSISAIELHDVCCDAKDDGLANPMIERFARLRGGQHAHEDVMRLVRENTPVFDMVDSLGEPNSVATSVLLPSRVAMSLLRFYPTQFVERLGASLSTLRGFWRRFRTQPQNIDFMASSPHLSGLTMAQLTTTIPITLHEDAGPISKGLSASSVSWSSLVGKGTEKVSHFPVGTWVKAKKAESLSTAPFWDRLLKDFEMLASGVDERGTPILQDEQGRVWRLVLVYAKADEQQRCDEWGLVHYNGPDEVCPDCLANRSSRPFTDCQETAAWRPTEAMSSGQYLARMRVPSHPLVASSFAWRMFFYLDVMHVMDCKGVAALIFGGVLASLVRRPSLGRSQVERLGAIQRFMREWYDDNPGTQRLPKITPPMLVAADGWADLHAPNIKAANTRQAAPLFASMTAELCSGPNEMEVQLREVTSKLHEFYHVLATADRFLSDAEKERLREIVLSIGVAYQSLHMMSQARGWLRFPVRPKLHKMCHFPFAAGSINPRSVSCYADESHIGTLCQVWKKSISGRWTAACQDTVLCKRWLAVLLRFELKLD